MNPVLIRLEHDDAFAPAAPVGAPLGQPVALARTALHQELPGQGASVGIWECTPGRFRRQVAQAEYSYFICGGGSFTPDGGESIEFGAGDAIYFAADTQGTWDIRQTVRKTYLILG
ncbi:hypothetical protein D3C81_1706380 [compost metagenome]